MKLSSNITYHVENKIRLSLVTDVSSIYSHTWWGLYERSLLRTWIGNGSSRINAYTDLKIKFDKP